MRERGAIVIPGLTTGMDLVTFFPLSRASYHEFRFVFESYLKRRGPDTPVRSLEELIATGKYLKNLQPSFDLALGVESLDFDREYLARLKNRLTVRQAPRRPDGPPSGGCAGPSVQVPRRPSARGRRPRPSRQPHQRHHRSSRGRGARRSHRARGCRSRSSSWAGPSASPRSCASPTPTNGRVRSEWRRSRLRTSRARSSRMGNSVAPAILLGLTALRPIRWFSALDRVIDVEDGRAIENGSIAVEGRHVATKAASGARLLDLGNLDPASRPRRRPRPSHPRATSRKQTQRPRFSPGSPPFRTSARSDTGTSSCATRSKRGASSVRGWSRPGRGSVSRAESAISRASD